MTPRVAVIGAGIAGATIGYFLSRAGAAVSVFEEAEAAGQGVTRQSFGWVNSVMAPPQTLGEIYALRRDAHLRYRDMNQAFSGRLFGAQRGSLSWTSDASETEAFALTHVERGAEIRRIGKDEFVALAPQVRTPPELAVQAPNDISIDASEVAVKLLKAARDAGTDVKFGQKVRCVTTKNKLATGVRFDDEYVGADFVVVAAGSGTQSLVEDFAPTLRIELSSAVKLAT